MIKIAGSSIFLSVVLICMGLESAMAQAGYEVLCDPFEANLPDQLTMCDREPIVLDAGNPGAEYVWSNINSGQTVGTDRYYTVEQAGVYMVTVTNACGSNTDKVVIQELYTPTLELAKTQYLCDGETLALDSKNFGSSSKWVDLSTGEVVANTRRYVVAKSGMYELTTTNECGSRTDVIEVIAKNSLEISLGEDKALCNNEPLELSAGIFEGAFYEWWDIEKDQRISEDDHIIVTKAGKYAVNITDVCGFYTDTILVAQHGLPELNLKDTILVCDDSPEMLDLKHPGSTFVWKRKETGEVVSTEQVYPAGEAGAFVVEVSNTCWSISKTFEVMTKSSPTLSLKEEYNYHSGNFPVTLTVADQGIDTINWIDIKTGEIISTQFSADFAGPGEFYVTAGNTCATVGQKFEINLITGIEEIASEDEILVFPNPSDGRFVLKLGKKVTDPFVLIVRDMQGKCVFQKTSDRNSSIQPVDLSSNAPGVYLVQVVLNGKSLSKKIVVK